MATVEKLMGTRVFQRKEGRKGEGKPRRLGRIHMAVFSSDGKMLVGFLVKRPDVAGMVKRQDIFLAYDSFAACEEGVLVTDEREGIDDAARRRLQLEWDSCVMWTGMDAKTTEGKVLGYVNDANFDPATGQVQSFCIGDGGMARSLVGSVEVPASLLRGYSKGFMILDASAAKLSLSGGAAAKAGEGYAKAKMEGAKVAKRADAAASAAVDKGSLALGRALGKARRAVGDTAATSKPAKAAAGSAKAKPQAKRGAQTDEVARAVGRQVGKMSGMFGSFMDEYKKASK